MSAGQMRGGHCAWHNGWAEDVALAVVIEQGSGAGGSQYACLPCARPLVQRVGAPPWLAADVEAMEARAAAAAPSSNR